MNILRSILLPAAFAGLLLASPLLSSEARACGYSPAVSPAALIQSAAMSAMGGDESTLAVDSLRFAASDRAVVDVRDLVGPRAGRVTRLVARFSDGGWRVTGFWTIREAGSRSRTVAAR